MLQPSLRAAIGFQTLWGYVVALIVYQLGGLFTGELSFGVWTVIAAVTAALIIYLLFRKGYQADTSVRTLTSVEASGV